MTVSSLRVRLNGGLGNQLFQVAAAVFLRQQLRPRETILDAAEVGITHDRVGVLAITLPPWLRVSWDTSRSPLPMATGRGLIWAHRLTSKRGATVLNNSSARQMIAGGALNIAGKVMADDFFQMDYIASHAMEICPSLAAPELRKESDWFKSERAHISRTRSLGIHIRRGDFDVTRGLLHEDYYREATLIAQRESPEEVLLFSDDPEVGLGMLSRLSLTNLRVIQVPRFSPAIESLLLLSQCAAIISANSTFSWWAAKWAKGLVIAPSSMARTPTPEEELKDRELRASHVHYITPSWIDG